MPKTININGSSYTIEDLSKILNEYDFFKNPVLKTKDLIAKNQITQKELAKKIGCSQANISMQLSENRKPSARWLYKLSKATIECQNENKKR